MLGTDRLFCFAFSETDKSFVLVNLVKSFISPKYVQFTSKMPFVTGRVFQLMLGFSLLRMTEIEAWKL